MKRILLFVLFVVLALVFVMPVAAQSEAIPNPTKIETAANGLLALLVAVAGTTAASPLVTGLTGILKMIVPRLDPRFLSVVIAILITVSLWAGEAFGFKARLETIYDWLLLALPAIGALFGATVTYNKAREAEVPVLGYTPEAPPQG